MSTSTSAASTEPSVDSNVEENLSAPLWKYVTKDIVVDADGVARAGGGNVSFTCSFCEMRFNGSHSRVQAHLLKIPRKGIKPCTKVTQAKMQEMQQLLDWCAQQLRERAPNKVPLPPSSSFSGSGSSYFPLMERDDEAKKRRGKTKPNKSKHLKQGLHRVKLCSSSPLQRFQLFRHSLLKHLTSDEMDGLIRWFQRISTSSSSTSSPDHHHNATVANDQSSEEDEELTITVDLDMSGLKPIKVPIRTNHKLVSTDHHKNMLDNEFFTEYGEASQYEIQEVIGKGSYGVVASAVDTHTGEKVAIKKINDVFEHVSDATRILREIKLLRLLHHPDIVDIKHIMLPPCRREFKDIYVVFELMESDLHQVIRANDDLTPEHYQFFLYQLLRALKYIHTGNVFHRDLKPKNILANADCKLKICDFGLARPSFSDAPSTVFWTDYVATRWYRAPELCGSFFSKYTPAIDIWSIGCIFAEMLTGKPLFPGKNVVHQLDLITDLLGTPSTESIARIRNEKARRYLSNMKKKKPTPLSQKMPNADPLALRLLERLLAFDPRDRISAEEALSDPYFYGLANKDNEPSKQPISKLEFDFEKRKLTKDDVRELIYREILEYHPKMLHDYLEGSDNIGFMYPSGVDRFRRQFAHLEEQFGKGDRSTALQRKHASLPRERVCMDEGTEQNGNSKKSTTLSAGRAAIQSPPKSQRFEVTDSVGENGSTIQNGLNKRQYSPHSLVKSDSMSASQCVVVKGKYLEKDRIAAQKKEMINVVS